MESVAACPSAGLVAPSPTQRPGACQESALSAKASGAAQEVGRVRKA